MKTASTTSAVAANSLPFELVVVMPVFNEAACLAEVVGEWLGQLRALGLRFQLLLLNDGSTDDTSSVLAMLEKETELQVVNKSNSGHGPTILMGYEMALDRAEWVFQCDSDGEMSADAFPNLWSQRGKNSFVLGQRKARKQSAGRLLLSSGSRFAVALLGGGRRLDVNSPYRLIRTDLLAQILPIISSDCFAPNVCISLAVGHWHVPFSTIDVPHIPRRSGQASLASWKIWRAGLIAAVQTLRFRLDCPPCHRFSKF